MELQALQFSSGAGRILLKTGPGKSALWKTLCRSSAILVILATVGCQEGNRLATKQLVVHRTPGPIQLDGQLSASAWRRAQAVALEVPREIRKQGLSLEEPGSARLLWDDRFLYIAFDFVDSDVVAFGKEGDEGQQLLGDVAEIFLKRPEQTWYWEFHVTPAGYVTQNWNVGRGRWGLKDVDRRVSPRFVVVAARVQGTLNDWHDRDQGWTAEVAIPFDKLDRFGELTNPRENWTILLARYNYTRYRKQATGPELSSWPPLSRPFFHLVEEYASLKLVP
jgi:hypothetical protein